MKAKKYAIIDIETTGGLVRRDKITEIGIVLHDGERIIDRFESLVNPERSIPEYISRMTGITDEMVAGAPRFFEIARQIVELTEGAVFVAHNARFDYGFIREEFQRLGYTYSRRQLCTVRLTRQTFPELRKYNLDALIRHFGIRVEHRHRALDDALATAQVFEHILRTQNGHAGIHDLINQGIRESRLPPGITLEGLHGLPEETGVYYFHDATGHVVYVGKSINIRSRVMQHFAEITNKSATMHRRVHEISYEITGSELAALLLENHEIKKLQPEINRAQRRNAYPFVLYVATDAAGYLTLDIQKGHRIPPGGQILQEYTGKQAAKNHLSELIGEFALCMNKTALGTGPGPCFNRQVAKCMGACTGEESDVDYNDRVLEAMTATQKRINGSCVIIDKGRTYGERTLIAVENGRYCGFGYLDEGVPLARIDEAMDYIRYFPETPESMKIIHSHLACKKVERVVRW